MFFVQLLEMLKFDIQCMSKMKAKHDVAVASSMTPDLLICSFSVSLLDQRSLNSVQICFD